MYLSRVKIDLEYVRLLEIDEGVKKKDPPEMVSSRTFLYEKRQIKHTTYKMAPKIKRSFANCSNDVHSNSEMRN